MQTFPVQTLSLLEVVQAGGKSDSRYDYDKPQGLRMFLLENGYVVVERPGHPDVLISPHTIKSLILRGEYDYSSGKIIPTSFEKKPEASLIDTAKTLAKKVTK